MDLALVLQNTQPTGLLWCGISGKQLGKLPQGEVMDLKLSLISTVPGLQVRTVDFYAPGLKGPLVASSNRIVCP